MINIRNLVCGYKKHTVTSSLNYKFEEDKITTIIGQNGSGKSTLLKTISRILKPKNGLILLDDKNIYDYDNKDFSKKLSILFQTSQVLVNLSVFDIVSLGRFPHNNHKNDLKKEDIKIIEDSLEAVGIKKLIHKCVNELSGGQKQSVWIAMILAQKTKYILLDEPITFLDPYSQIKILKLVKKLNCEENKTIIMTLHNINLASIFSHNIVLMNKGNILCSGTPKNVITNKNLKKGFSIDAEVYKHPKLNKPLVLTYDLIKEI